MTFFPHSLYTVAKDLICFVCISNGTTWGVGWVEGLDNQVICYDIVSHETEEASQQLVTADCVVVSLSA